MVVAEFQHKSNPDLVIDLLNDDNYLKVSDLAAVPVHVKVEGLNPAGSIKLKTALSLINDCESKYGSLLDLTIIESSSGNLGIALSMIAAQRGYKFECVVDPNTPPSSINTMRAFGAHVVCVTERDLNGGYLGTRIEYIKSKIENNSNYIWLNQYSNPANPAAHEATTAPALHEKLGHIDLLFIGAGTTGTLMGCCNYFRRESPTTKIIAVDCEGSVTFDAPAGPRRIPGLGTSVRPGICDTSLVDAVVFVREIDTISTCRWVARTHGVLFGGSTGTVLAAIKQNGDLIEPDMTVATISPDIGERYLDTIYSDDWVLKHYPEFSFEQFSEGTTSNWPNQGLSQNVM